jgi:hypothetical protein
MNEQANEREALLAKAKAAEDMAGQFPDDTYLRLSWMLIADSYRDLAMETDIVLQSRLLAPRGNELESGSST